MRLCFWKAEEYPTFAQAIQGGGMREISGLTSPHERLIDAADDEAVGDLADSIRAIELTANLFDGNYTVRFVLFDDEANFLDTM